MKKNNISKVLLITILFICVLTWIFPTAYYSGGLIEDTRLQIGIFDLFSYPLVALSYFSQSFFYVLMVGALYGVLYKIPAYRLCLEKISKGFKNKEWIFLVISILSIALLVSITGFSFGIIVIFPIIISLILMLGYNKITAVLSTVGATICGIIGTTIGVETVRYINYSLGTEVTDNTKIKVILLVLSTGVLLFNTLRYSKKTLNKIEDSETYLVPEKVTIAKNKKVNIWPLVVLFDVMFIILLIGIFPWETIFPKFTAFSDALAWVKDYELFGFPIFDKILGGVNVFGSWSYTSSQGSIVAALPATILIATIVIGFVYSLKVNEIVDSAINGIKKALAPGLLMVVAYLVLIICVYHPFQLTIFKWMLGFVKNFAALSISFKGILWTFANTALLSIVTLLGTLFNVDSMYLSSQVLPYVVSVIGNEDVHYVLSIIFQAIHGLGLLVLPTSLVLIGTLQYTKISYLEWLKHIWKIFLELFAMIFILVVIISLI